MSQRLTIAKAERRWPDMIKGQIWHGRVSRYWFKCKKHGRYRQWWGHHSKGCPQCGHTQGGVNRRTGRQFKCVICKIIFYRPKSYWLKDGRKTEPKFCSRRCQRAKGHLRADGYIQISVNGKLMGEHRYKMEKKLGRKLRRNETVHHKNGVRSDNRFRNLELWSGRHAYGQRVKDLVRDAKEILKLYGKAA